MGFLFDCSGPWPAASIADVKVPTIAAVIGRPRHCGEVVLAGEFTAKNRV